MIVVGLLFLVLAPVWAWGIAPLFIKLPGDLKVVTDYKGTLTLYADQVTRRFFPPGQEKVVPLTIHAEDKSILEKCTSRVLVVDEHVDVTDTGTGLPMAGVRPNATYVLDRRTSENVPGYIEGVDRSGWSLTFPLGSKKKSYPVWDDELKSTIGYNFVREKKMDGEKYKGVKVYVYSTPGEMERMAKPPPGLPETMSGKQLKEMSGRDDLPISDTSELKLEFYKKVESTQYVEPRTGAVVYVPRLHYEYYVKNGPGMVPAYLKLASVEYTRTAANSRKDLDGSAKYFKLMDLDQIWTPVSFLVFGAVFLTLGVASRLRSARRAKEEVTGPDASG
jgi:hypothetical protein